MDDRTDPHSKQPHERPTKNLTRLNRGLTDEIHDPFSNCDATGFNPGIYDRAQEQPVPPAPHLALDDADWTASHRADGSVMVGSTLKEALA